LVLVAYSGSVDSTLLASVAHEVLGQRMLAVTASSPIRPASEIAEAESVAKEMGIRHITVEASPGDMMLLSNVGRSLRAVSELQALGYTYVTLDLAGYGSERRGREGRVL